MPLSSRPAYPSRTRGIQIRHALRLVAVSFLLILGGCAIAPAANKHWWNPSTWLSDSEAATVARKDAARDAAREKLLAAAQTTAHETALALASAPASRPVEIATESAAQTVQALDQVAGPLTAAAAAQIRAQIAALLSDNVALRAEGEQLRAASRETLTALSARLAKAETALAAANAALPDALRREASTANKYRNLMFGFWALAALAALAGVAWIYVRFFSGGFAGLIGKALARADASNPTAAHAAREILDDVLSLRDQARVAAHAAKAALKAKTAS